MHVPIESLPDDARVWVYQSNRTLTISEEQWLTNALTRFCGQWAAHEVPLQAAFQVLHHQFIVLAVDEQANGASGCSIDASVHALQAMQRHVRADFFDRRQLAFLIDGAVALYPQTQISALLAGGTLTGATLYFHNLPTDLGAWRRGWLQRIDSSWLSRYLPKAVPAA